MIRLAQAVLAAIHRDMDGAAAGLKPIPRDVGSFIRLQDDRDASQYLILIPYDPDDCTCRRAGKYDGPQRRLPGRQQRRFLGPLDATHRRGARGRRNGRTDPPIR